MQCALGLEALLAAELLELGIATKKVDGGVECRADAGQLAQICLLSRVAESVRVRLKEFEAQAFTELEKKLRALPFRSFLAATSEVRVKVVCHKSKLWHSDAVKARVESVLQNHVAWKISETETADVVHVRLDEDRVQVSLDATGERLHRRGHRTQVGKASLRETLAAALCLSVDRSAYLKEAPVIWDPFCGAGTIPLEMLSLARGRVPGANRVHAFEHFREHDKEAFSTLKSDLIRRHEERAPAPALRAILSDRSAAALTLAEENMKSAGFESACEYLVGDVLQIAPKVPEGAFILSNPPYGKRLDETGATKKLLSLLERRPDLRPVILLLGGPARELVPKDRPALFRTKNGGIPVSARLLRA